MTVHCGCSGAQHKRDRHGPPRLGSSTTIKPTSKLAQSSRSCLTCGTWYRQHWGRRAAVDVLRVTQLRTACGYSRASLTNGVCISTFWEGNAPATARATTADREFMIARDSCCELLRRINQLIETGCCARACQSSQADNQAAQKTKKTWEASAEIIYAAQIFFVTVTFELRRRGIGISRRQAASAPHTLCSLEASLGGDSRLSQSWRPLNIEMCAHTHGLNCLAIICYD